MTTTIIKKPSRDYQSFGSLTNGTVFKYRNDYYIKISNCAVASYNAYSFIAKEAQLFVQDTKVEVIDCEIYILENKE